MIDFSWLADLDFEHHLPPEVVIEQCLNKALYMKEHPKQFFLSEEIPDTGKLVAMLVRLEVEEYRKSKLIDTLAEYDDEIISIEDLGEDIEMMDITVSGNNTFHANGILTKNSHGLAMTVDLLLSMIRTEELDETNQVLFKQLKNRFSDMASRLRFTVGIDRSKMTLYDTDSEIQTTPRGEILHEGSPKSMIKSSVMNKGSNLKGKFGGIQI